MEGMDSNMCIIYIFQYVHNEQNVHSYYTNIHILPNNSKQLNTFWYTYSKISSQIHIDDIINIVEMDDMYFNMRIKYIKYINTLPA